MPRSSSRTEYVLGFIRKHFGLSQRGIREYVSGLYRIGVVEELSYFGVDISTPDISFDVLKEIYCLVLEGEISRYKVWEGSR